MSRRFKYIILFVLAIGLSFLSIAHLSNVARESGTEVAKSYPAPTTSDAWEYAAIAKNIIQNGNFSIEKQEPYLPDTFRTPGYPFFLVLFYKAFNSFYPVLFVQTFLVFLNSIIIFKLGEKVMGEKWAILPAVFYILDPATLFGVSAIFSETLFIFLFLSFIYILFFFQTKNWLGRAAWAGLLLGLSALVRPVALYLPIFLLPFYFFIYRKSLDFSWKKYFITALVFLSVFIACVLPWFIRNHQVSGIWGFTGNSTYTLFRHNAAIFYATVTGGNVTEVRKDLLERAGLPRGEVPRGLEHSAALQKVATDIIFADPVRYTIYHVSSLPSFFLNSSFHLYFQFTKDMVGDVARKPEPALSHAILTRSWPTFVEVMKNHGWELVENAFWALITFELFLGIFKSKNVMAGRLFALIVLYFAILTGPISHARYRMPATPFMLLGAFSTLAYFWEKRKTAIVIS